MKNKLVYFILVLVIILTLATMTTTTDAQHDLFRAVSASIFGSGGTADKLAKFSGGTTLVDSTITCTGSAVTIGDGTDTIAINSSDWDIGATGDVTGLGSVTLTGITIGANTLDTNEWALLDGQDQAILTTSNVTHNNLTLTGQIDWDGSANTEEIAMDITFAIDGGAVDYDLHTLTSSVTDSTAHNLTGYIMSINRSNTIDAGGYDGQGGLEIVMNDGPDVNIQTEGIGHAMYINDLRSGAEANNADEAALYLSVANPDYTSLFSEGGIYCQSWVDSTDGFRLYGSHVNDLVSFSDTFSIGSGTDWDFVTLTSTITDSASANLTGAILNIVINNTIDAGGTDTLAPLEMADKSGGTDRYCQFRFDEGNGGLELYQSTDGSSWTLTHTFELDGTVSDEVP